MFGMTTVVAVGGLERGWFRMRIGAVFCRFVRGFGDFMRDFGWLGGLRFGGFGGGEVPDDVPVKRFEGGLFDVGGSDLEAVEEEGGLAAVNGGGEDTAEHPLQGALDGVGVFQQETLRVQGDAGGVELLAVGFWRTGRSFEAGTIVEVAIGLGLEGGRIAAGAVDSDMVAARDAARQRSVHVSPPPPAGGGESLVSVG